MNNTNIKDIIAVSKWLHTDIDNLQIEYTKEPILTYEKQVKEMLSTYSFFPKDEKRTYRIKKLIEKGNDILPIYVEKDDPASFILEGRHRIVAFYLLGLKEISVARISCKTKKLKL